MYSKCMMRKAYSSKKYQKISWHRFSKIELYWSKVWKMDAKMKNFQSNVNTFVGGHICLFLLVRYVTWLRVSCVWLDWIDHWNFMLDYGLVYTWFTHTTHKSNVQWMPISFVWLYVFKYDMCIFNCLMIKLKKIFECFISFWKCFCVSLVFWNFFPKSQICFVEKTHLEAFSRLC